MISLEDWIKPWCGCTSDVVACKVLLGAVSCLRHLVLRAASFHRGLLNVPQAGAVGNWCTPYSGLVEIPKELEMSSLEEGNVFPKGV